MKKPFTVLALYEDNLQRYADSVEAENAEEAEQLVTAAAPEPILVAGVIRGNHDCADVGRGCSADPCICGVCP